MSEELHKKCQEAQLKPKLKISGGEDFYPTPDSLLEQILDGLDWEKVNYVLEPSAGKGNIAVKK